MVGGFLAAVVAVVFITDAIAGKPGAVEWPRIVMNKYVAVFAYVTWSVFMVVSLLSIRSVFGSPFLALCLNILTVPYYIERAYTKLRCTWE